MERMTIPVACEDNYRIVAREALVFDTEYECERMMAIIEAARALVNDGPPAYVDEDAGAVVCLRCRAVLAEEPHKSRCKHMALVRAIEAADRARETSK